MSDPVTLMGELDDLVARLDGASREIYMKDKEFEEVDAKFSDLWDEMLVQMVDDYEHEEKRLPGEDVRNAKLRRLMRRKHPGLYSQHRELKSALERLEKRARRIERSISSKQSQLSFLRTEAGAIQ